MLEHARNTQRPEWQKMTGSDLFFGNYLPDAANAELLNVMEVELRRLKADRIECAIWSNEWLFSRSAWVLPALQDLRFRGFQIEIQCYVRRHDKWAQSAYAQWGVKDKRYLGPIRDFESWLPTFGERDIIFARGLSTWDAAFGKDLRVFNFDAAGDVVQHFLSANCITDVPSILENVSPDSTTTAAQAVYNSMKQGAVQPIEFNRMLQFTTKLDENGVQLPPLDRLFPSVETLAAMVHDRELDIAQVNALLTRTGEPLLSFDSPPRQTVHPSPWEMDQMLLKLIFGLTEELKQVRGEVAALQKKIAERLADSTR